jgi:hypothetical protein
MQILLTVVSVSASKNHGNVCVAINKTQPQCHPNHAFTDVRIFKTVTLNWAVQKSPATQFRYAAPNICGSSAWFMLLVSRKAPRIVRWLLAFWKIYGPLASNATDILIRVAATLHGAILDNVAGRATCYSVDGSRFTSRWRQDISSSPQPYRPALGPTQPPVQRVTGLFPRGKETGAWPPTPIYCRDSSRATPPPPPPPTGITASSGLSDKERFQIFATDKLLHSRSAIDGSWHHCTKARNIRWNRPWPPRTIRSLGFQCVRMWHVSLLC